MQKLRKAVIVAANTALVALLGCYLGGLRLVAQEHELELQALRQRTALQAAQLEETRLQLTQTADRLEQLVAAHNGWADTWNQHTADIQTTAQRLCELECRFEAWEAEDEGDGMQLREVWPVQIVRLPGGALSRPRGTRGR